MKGFYAISLCLLASLAFTSVGRAKNSELAEHLKNIQLAVKDVIAYTENPKKYEDDFKKTLSEKSFGEIVIDEVPMLSIYDDLRFVQTYVNDYQLNVGTNYKNQEKTRYILAKDTQIRIHNILIAFEKAQKDVLANPDSDVVLKKALSTISYAIFKNFEVFASGDSFLTLRIAALEAANDDSSRK